MTILKTITCIITLIISLHTGGGQDVLDTQTQLMEAYDSIGMTAYDADNRLDIRGSEELLEKLRACAGGDTQKIRLMSISGKGNTVRYDLDFDGSGNLTVTMHAMTWRNLSGNSADSVGLYEETFPASDWKLTDGGYLFIQREFIAGWDGPHDQIGIRISPLDAECREYNREYVLPLGYKECTLLTTDWNEEDYSGLNIREVFSKLFQYENGCTPDMVYGDAPTAITGDAHGEQTAAEIPKEDFEDLIGRYFNMDTATIEMLGGYEENGGYFYLPRSFDDNIGPYAPYPEVVACEKEADGTLLLTVQAVSVQDANDRAAVSRLRVKPEEGGGWKYLGNEI